MSEYTENVEPLTEKQWEEIWKYFGFSKKRRMILNGYDRERRTLVVCPNGETYDWDYPCPTFKNIFTWIFPQLISWAIEKDTKGYLWIRMDLKSYIGSIYSEEYLDDDPDMEEVIQLIGKMLSEMIW